MKSSRNLAAWVVMGLLIVGLMGFGTQNFSGQVDSLGTIGGRDVPIRDYANLLNNQQAGLTQQAGRQVSFAEMQQAGLDQIALQSLVTRGVIEAEADRLGLSVGDEAVRDSILSSGSFSQINGQFDRALYREALSRSGLSEADYEERIRAASAGDLLRGAVLSGVPHVDPFVQVIEDFRQQTRDFSWVEVTEPLAEITPPTEDELGTFYDENTDLFMAPESRQISAALLTPAMLVDDVVVDEAALQERYDERSADYNMPARALVERLVYGTQDEADAAKARLDAGTAFEDLVTERGLSLEQIDLGDVEKPSLGAAAEAVFSAAQGDVVGPFASRVGPALYRVNGLLDAQITSFDDALPELREELALVRAARLIDDRRNAIEDMIAGGARIEDLAANADMQAQTADWQLGASEGLFAYPAIDEIIPTLSEGDLPKLVPLADGGLAALALTGITAAAPQPKDQVQDALRDAWISAQTVTGARAQAALLAEQLEGGTGFADLGLEAAAERGLTRSDIVNAPADLLGAAFEMEPGELRVIDTPNGAIVLRVEAAGRSEDSDPDLARAQSEQLSRAILSDILSSYELAVQSRTDISIDSAALNAVHAQMR